MANEKRLIDANHIAYHKSGFPEKDGQNGRLDWAFREDIEKLPAIDAVEVVRCKDCQWWNKAGCAIRINCDEDKPTENGFCSYGEKREVE